MPKTRDFALDGDENSSTFIAAALELDVIN